MYSKPYLPIVDQIALLQRRGMVVESFDKAAEYLQRIGYYRLSAYWHPMRKRSEDGKEVLDDFYEGTTFKEATDLYTFDSRLRLVMLDGLERLEVALRTEVALTLGQRHPKAHREMKYFGPNFKKTVGKGGATKHRLWLQRLDESFLKSKDRFAEHFRTQYPGDDMPIWIAVELLDFGPLSHLIGGLSYSDASKVGSDFGNISPKHLTTWSHALSFTRNVCAHHSRLWNRPLVNQPSISGPSLPKQLMHIHGAPGANTRLYAVACVVRYMLGFANPRTAWKDRFTAHIRTFPASPRLTLENAGFPPNWDQEDIWS